MSPSVSHTRKAVGLALVLACVASPALAQRATPVHWSFTSRKLSPTLYELHMTATIDAGWRIYSQTPGGDGPIPTSFRLTRNPLVTPTGKIKEAGRLIRADDVGFGFMTHAYEGKVDFVQVVTKKGAGPATVAGQVEAMATKGKEALPPLDVDFAIKLD